MGTEVGRTSHGSPALRRMRGLWARVSRSLFSNRGWFLVSVMVVLGIALGICVDGFLRPYNLLNMSKYSVEIGLLALAEMVVMIAGGGGIDLSVGSMVSLLSVAVGFLSIRLGMGVLAAVPMTLCLGALLGAVNGTLVGFVGIPPLIATLGTMYMYKSIALVSTGGMPFSGFKGAFCAIGQGDLLGIPLQVVLVLIPAVIGVDIVLRKTVYGRCLYGCGCNETAARFALVRVNRTRFWAYVLGGVLVSLAALVLTSRVATAKPDAGAGLELQAITIAVLGGASVMGGVGSAVGTLLSALTVTMINNALDLSGVHPIWQLGTLGTLLVGSIFLNEMARNWAESSWRMTAGSD